MKLFLKGILLYATILSVIIFICSIDSLYDKGYFYISCIGILIQGITCYSILSIEDVYKLTFTKSEDIDNIA